MKIGTRIICFYLAIMALCFSYPLNRVLGDLRVRYLEGVEDPLVDQAQILAGLVGYQMEKGWFNPHELYAVMQKVGTRPLKAQIYEMTKTRVDMRVYITDATGNLVFDSQNEDNLGADYSQWRDVALTLDGRYGARTTQQDPTDEESSVLYVAAPVMVNETLAGVLTVAKPTTNINGFLKQAKPRISQMGLTALAGAGVLCLLASMWITLPVKRLTRYASDVHRGKRVPFPKLDSSEIGAMGRAFKRMQTALEGKNYVEQYVQTLTHEIKSPLSAIRGAAELLAEPMAAEKRDRFLANIRSESTRIQEIVDRMLELSTLENQRMIARIESVALNSLVKAVIESKRPMLTHKQLVAEVRVPPEIVVNGDSFLLHQAIGNLLQNAIEFSPANTKIDLKARIEGEQITLTVSDAGPGFPDYARDRLFDKFFSLQRPDDGKKSTGLGLNFVKEVAVLHGGEISLEQVEPHGTRAILKIARKPSA